MEDDIAVARCPSRKRVALRGRGSTPPSSALESDLAVEPARFAKPMVLQGMRFDTSTLRSRQGVAQRLGAWFGTKIMEVRVLSP